MKALFDQLLTRRHFLVGTVSMLALSILTVRGRRPTPSAAQGNRFLTCWSPRAPIS
jgi:hypothetical protein